MGFNTTVFILNDRLDELKRNPQKFVDELVSAIHRGEENSFLTGQTTVMRTAHADVHRLYMSHGNGMIDLSFPYSAGDEIKRRGGGERYIRFLTKYYKDQIKIARSILRDWDKKIQEFEEKEKVERCKHGVWKGDHCYSCEKRKKK